MSYCRFSEADVYVYADVYGGVVCCGCWLSENIETFYSAPDLIAHLRDHLAAGHDVPERLLDAEMYDPEDFQHRSPARSFVSAFMSDVLSSGDTAAVAPQARLAASVVVNPDGTSRMVLL